MLGIIILPLIALIMFLIMMIRVADRRKAVYIIGAYLSVLVMSLILLQTFPRESFRYSQTDSEYDESRYEKFYNAAMEGRLEELEDVHVSKQWEFNSLDSKFEIVFRKGTYFTTPIFIEKKQINDGKIEAAFYVSKSVLSGVDFTKNIMPPDVVVKGNKIEITPPYRQSIEVARFKRDFTITQFTDKEETSRQQFSLAGRQRILYLRIPKDLELTSSDANLQFTN